MTAMKALVKRNVKLFFKDKGMFFTALITPVILLVLYATFLGNVYKESFLSALPEGVEMAEEMINGFVGGQLVSSILAVSCVTVAFCSNMLMVQDKVSGAIKDLTIAPVRKHTLALSYYMATLIATLIICVVAMAICLVYVAFIGWYMSISDILFLLLDIFLLVMFGTALSSIINFFMSSQGQISAVGSIISAGYGFICGAYMPISQFSDGLQNVISFLPGTYGTSLVRNHSLRGVFSEMQAQGFPGETVEAFKDTVDCNLYFFGEKVPVGIMYLILATTVVALVGVYVLMNVLKGKNKK
ncbi:MAG: ABC transporter permease [Ruminococcaceae bacterium]|nr:ABC transporter permease [Oscillospiraceae bacterium]